VSLASLQRDHGAVQQGLAQNAELREQKRQDLERRVRRYAASYPDELPTDVARRFCISLRRVQQILSQKPKEEP
jgi:hypothetical protein